MWERVEAVLGQGCSLWDDMDVAVMQVWPRN